MRLWHQDLISKLPRQQLLGQHQECCALRGKGWGKKHETVDYVFTYDLYTLYLYHMKIIEEKTKRGYKSEEKWLDFTYRGKILGYDTSVKPNDKFNTHSNQIIYPEHDDKYLQECIINLKNKGITIAT